MQMRFVILSLVNECDELPLPDLHRFQAYTLDDFHVFIILF